MKRALLSFGVLATALWTSAALPCGGPFGGDTVVRNQSILVAHKAGTETYVFRPDFCGKSQEFGLILPVPAPLSSNPTLAEASLFAELDTASAPTVVHEKTCTTRGGVGAGGDAGASFPDAGGVNTINTGTVGIFTWSLIKADSASAFTSWLDTNTFAHDASDDAIFSHYVTSGWYFVAFKVTAGVNAPPPNAQLCGNLGPLSLAFPSAVPVLPARIAAAGSGRPGYPSAPTTWRVFGVSDMALELDPATTGAIGTRRFSGSLTAPILAGAPALAKLAASGDHLVELDISFTPKALTSDFTLRASGNTADYRESVTVYDYVECDGGIPSDGDAGPTTTRSEAGPGNNATNASGGCSSSPGTTNAAGLTLLGMAVAFGVALLRRMRRRR